MCFSLTLQNGVAAVNVALAMGNTDIVDILVKAGAQCTSMV